MLVAITPHKTITSLVVVSGPVSQRRRLRRVVDSRARIIVYITCVLRICWRIQTSPASEYINIYLVSVCVCDRHWVPSDWLRPPGTLCTRAVEHAPAVRAHKITTCSLAAYRKRDHHRANIRCAGAHNIRHCSAADLRYSSCCNDKKCDWFLI